MLQFLRRWLAVPQPLSACHCLYPCDVLRVVDADTFDLRILLPLGLEIRDTCRAADYDAVESSKRRRSVEVTDDEVTRGKAARTALEAYLAGRRTEVELRGRDVYGRPLVVLWVDGESIAAWINREGWARV